MAGLFAYDGPAALNLINSEYRGEEGKEMIERYKEAKSKFVQFYANSRSKAGKIFWEKRIEWCDHKIAQDQRRKRELRKRILRMVIIINLLAIISVCIYGCHFVSGCGTAISGLGDDITLASEGYMEKHRSR